MTTTQGMPTRRTARTRPTPRGTTEDGAPPRDGGRRSARLRRRLTGVVGVLLVIGASTVGLHDWADAQLPGQAVHGSAAGDA